MLPTSGRQSLQARLFTKTQVPCAITLFKASCVRSCYWIAILHHGPYFRFLPVTLCRLVYLPERHEDQQGGPAPPITTGHSRNPWLSRQGFAKRPRYPKVSGHTDRGKTDSATLCFGAGMLLARHGLFRDVNAWPHRKLVKLPDIPQTEWAYFTRPQHSGIFCHRHPS